MAESNSPHLGSPADHRPPRRRQRASRFWNGGRDIALCRGGRRLSLRRGRDASLWVAGTQIAQEAAERVHCRDRTRNGAEFCAGCFDWRGHHFKGAAVGAITELAGVSLADSLQANRFLTQGIADRGAQDIGPLALAERLETLPPLAIKNFDLLGRVAPALRRPPNIGAYPARFLPSQSRHHFERHVVAAEIG